MNKIKEYNMIKDLSIKRLMAVMVACFSVMAVTLSSCTGAAGEAGNILSGDSTVVRVKFQTPSAYSVSTKSTRALSSTNENNVDNLYIMVFDGSGNLVGCNYTAFSTPQSSAFTANVTVHEDATCTIYALANIDQSALSGVTSIGKLDSLSLSIDSAADLGNKNDIAMFGKVGNIDVSSITDTNIPSITLQRMESRMDVSITPGSGITITGYHLCNIPTSSYVADSTLTGGRYNPAGKYVSFPEVSGLSMTSSFTDIYYMYENKVGKNANAITQMLRTTANAPANATYVTIWATGSNWTSEYKIYLGGPSDDTTDYDIERNSHYTYNIEINGQGANDVRVIETTAIFPGSTVSDWQNATGSSVSSYN